MALSSVRVSNRAVGPARRQASASVLIRESCCRRVVLAVRDAVPIAMCNQAEVDEGDEASLDLTFTHPRVAREGAHRRKHAVPVSGCMVRQAEKDRRAFMLSCSYACSNAYGW